MALGLRFPFARMSALRLLRLVVVGRWSGNKFGVVSLICGELLRFGLAILGKFLLVGVRIRRTAFQLRKVGVEAVSSSCIVWRRDDSTDEPSSWGYGGTD